MNGRVKVFFDQKGYGFITSDNNNDYFFHINDVKTTDKPYIGMEVTFEIGHGPKGTVAKNICAISVPTKKSFIIIGDTRIKLNNIKMYEIRDDKTAEAGEYGTLKRDANGNIIWIVFGKMLYIKTFQGDCYEFTERSGIDVYAKLEELDKYLCN